MGLRDFRFGLGFGVSGIVFWEVAEKRADLGLETNVGISATYPRVPGMVMGDTSPNHNRDSLMQGPD